MSTLQEENINEEEQQVAQMETIPFEEAIQPEVVNSFPAPFKSKIGNSSIDLSIPENEKEMLKDHDEWWSYGRKRWLGIVPYTGEDFKEERSNLREKFYQKYYGMSFEDYKQRRQEEATTIYGYKPTIKGFAEQMDNNFQALSVPGLAYADFTNDALGTIIPGYNKLDDRWDEATQLDNEVYQGLREILSVVLPAIHAGAKTQGLLSGSTTVQKMPWLQKTLTQIGAYGLADSAVTVLSDTSEDHNAAYTVSKLIPGLFGPKGYVPLPEAWKTKDSQSPAARKKMHFYENLGLSTFGTVLGALLNLKSATKTAVDFMEPLDETAFKYKQLQLFKESEPDDLIRLQELNTLLVSGKVNRQVENQIINEIIELEGKLGKYIDVDGAIKRQELGYKAEQQAAARIKLQDPNINQLELDLDPDISPVLDGSPSAARSVPGPAYVARNMADTTAIKMGGSEGLPAPIMTEAMREKGLMVGPKSRDAVMGVAEEKVGRFNAVVDGIRYTSKQMNAAAWDIYTSIIAAENMDDVRGLFLDNRDVKNFLMGRFKVEVFNEEQARAAAFALRDLTDRFLGREVSEASARVMDTLGRESAALAEAIQTGGVYVDDGRVMDLIIDKMQFLLDEYALNKYLSGWQLRNKNWFDQVPPKELDTVIEQLTKEFTDAENAIHARNLRFTGTLKELKKKNPNYIRPLVDAFAHTNGDVDTLAKLNKWAMEQITPMGMIKSPNPKEMNLFAKGTWSVVMNNVLSGLSAGRAMVGNSFQLVTKPITAFLGHGIWGTATGDFTGLQRTMYANSAIFETNRRALKDAFIMMKKAHKDPDMMIKAYRKDFTFQADKTWGIMEDMRAAWEQDGNWGKILQHDLAWNIKELGRHPAMRYGMTGLVFPDAYTSTMLAHYLARVKAYDDVFSELGYFKRSAVLVAEARHYKNFFDSNGLIKNDVLRAIAGEVQLNLDDGLANWLNQATTAYPITKFMMMFPRTSSNWIKNSASWTPLSLIPGFNKYADTIYARSDEQIAKALSQHGIDMATEPNARAIFENLRAEYTGRLAFSTLLVGTMWQYAMSGNIRGNGHYNASRRKKERDNYGYEPKTINIGGKWVSYKGILGVEQVLSILGDLAYYSNDLNEHLLSSWQSKLTWTISSSFLNETPLQGLEPLIAATNGDLSGWNRLVANTTRSLLPLSGGAGVLANAIDSSQKDLSGEILDYIRNRLPGFKNTLADQIDIWTGEPINDIENPVLKGLNAIMPQQVSGTAEPWRQFLMEIQFDGLSKLTRDSTGSYEYTTKEREYINKTFGSFKPFKEVQRIMKSKKYQQEIKWLKTHRTTNVDFRNKNLELKKRLLPIYQDLNNVVRKYQQMAEAKLLSERPDIAETIGKQQAINVLMKQGDVPGAAQIQKEDLEKQQLLQYGGSR